MNAIRLLTALLAAMSLVSISGCVVEDETAPATTISIEGMSCQNCANRVAKKLRAVPGVGRVRVIAQPGVAELRSENESGHPSPRALWEAVMEAGYTPLRLAGPQGTFETTPRH